MSKRNAHAVAARQRKAGAHKEAPAIVCEECGRDMGYRPPSHLCAPCMLGVRPLPVEPDKWGTGLCLDEDDDA